MQREVKYVGVLTTDADLVVHGWDPWLVDATGKREEDVRDRSLLELFPEIEQRGLVARLRRVLDDGTVEVLAPAFHHYLIRCPAPGAEPHFSEMQQHITISPLRDKQAITGLVITIEDVTARCVRERELAAQLKSQDETIRLRAARLLSQESTHAAPLLEVMDDTNWQVRQAAVRGVSRTADAEVVKQLVETVRDHHDDIGLLNSALSALALSRVDALPHLLPLLGNEHANVRMYTALALGNLHDARAIPDLVRLLDDSDVNVRYHAIEALGRVRTRDAAVALLPILEAKDPYLSFAALDAIGAIGERSVAPDVLKLLSDDALAPSAVEALGAIGDEKAAAQLARLLESNRVGALTVCRALAGIYRRLDEEYGEGQLVGDVVRAELSPDVVMRIINTIASASDDDLVAIARVLGWLQYEGVERALSGMLQHPRARKIAVEALVQRGVAATGALLPETASEDPEVRKAVAHALGRIGDRSALPSLIALLQDENAEVVITTAGALGSIGDRAAFDPLVELLAHYDAAVRHAAVSAINSIGHPETATRVAVLLASDDPNVRESAVRIAGYFGYKDALDAVLRLLSDPAEGVRRAAVEHLGYFDDERVLPALASALKGKSPAVRAVAARALAHIREADAEPHLAEAVADADARVRYQAVQAIAAQHIVEFAPTLRRLAREDAAVPVRIAATRALGELRDATATPLLVELAQHRETDIATTAIEALGEINVPQATAALQNALFGEDVRRQRAALDAVNEFHLPALLRELERLAGTSTDAAISARAIQLLAASDDERAIDVLLELAAEPERRPHVLAALSHVEEKQIHRVARGLRHPDPRIRSATVDALARMKRAAASRALGSALHDTDPAVRFATEQALGRLDLITHSARLR